MNKNDLLKLCWSKFEPIVLNFNVFLDDIEYVKEPKGNVLRIFIDKENGTIDIDDCEKASKKISEKLDELDPISEAYYLEVSSPGIDRPFRNDRDFVKNIGEVVEIKFYAPIDGKKEIEGKLISFDKNQIELEIDSKAIIVDRKKIATIRLSIFK
ncbi:ribosome maturation factor RimP [Miniphocaeibacter massiliensis]|uniref:ribosome maturation factor RimP n=1 Tax=Miniphocaeibacter massiliensis TaxID=2041841 RepID=UPI000C085850|nr:ribosome maturation factor RimP [Miniphocaeibacter massiliensis]